MSRFRVEAAAVRPHRGAMESASPAPRGPTGVFSNLLLVREFRKDLRVYLEGIAAEYGDLVPYSIAGIPIVQVSHPDPAVEVLSTKNASFQKPTLVKKVLGQWNGNGLVVNEGASWV